MKKSKGSASDHVVLLHVNREALGAGQLLASGHADILVGDDALQLRIGFHDGVLHQDAVLDDRTLLDLDAAEEHTVLDRALDDAAVGQQRVLHAGTVDVADGVVVADLGVDGAPLGEQSVQVLLVDELQVFVEVALHIADVGHITGVLHSADVQDVDVVCQDVALKVDQTAGGGVLDQLDQGLALQNVDVQVQILDAGAVIVEQQLGS